MGQAYTPALAVTERTRVRKRRELPLPGTVLVEKGARVKAQEIVLRAELPGDMTIVRMADRMGLDVDKVLKGMMVDVDQVVEKGSC